jgi:hypothetical protein
LSEESDLSYEDLCTDCEYHDKCHKTEINYDAIEKCNNELQEQLNKDDFYKFKRSDQEPKEKVQFT